LAVQPATEVQAAFVQLSAQLDWLSFLRENIDSSPRFWAGAVVAQPVVQPVVQPPV
jgi:hypothetical protein